MCLFSEVGKVGIPTPGASLVSRAMAASLQQQIDALSDAIAKGVRRVRLPDGTETEYHSLTDMLKVRGELEAEVSRATEGVYVQGAMGGLTGI